MAPSAVMGGARKTVASASVVDKPQLAQKGPPRTWACCAKEMTPACARSKRNWAQAWGLRDTMGSW
eukprot:13549176-Alexandrium_andersonii.AAC.1